MSSYPDINNDQRLNELRFDRFVSPAPNYGGSLSMRATNSFDTNHSFAASRPLSSITALDSNSIGSSIFKEYNRSSARSATCSSVGASSRMILPYITHCSDSGFSSTLTTSSDSCCSHLPPPPPYRLRNSSISSTAANSSSNANTIALPTSTSISPSVENTTNKNASMNTNHTSSTRDNPTATNISKAHRIHRSLSDSKYATTSYSNYYHNAPNNSKNKAYRYNNPNKSSFSLSSSSPHNNTVASCAASMQYLLNDSSLSTINNLSNSNNQHTTSWLSRSPSPSMSTVSCPEYPELQEKLHRLAMARDSLSLQVTVLTEQVGAQKEKIRDLESLLTSKRHKLDSTEELLQDHADNRGDLESKKLDLLAEVSNLKLKYATLEREKLETERKLRLSQAEIEHLNESMQGFMMQQHQLHNAHLQVQCPFPHAIPTEPTAIRMDPESASEMEQLRMAVQRLIVDNEQKNIQINSLRNALDEHCRNERDMAVSTVASAANFINMPSSATYIIPQKQFVYQNQQPPMVNNTNNLNNQLSNFYNDSINSQQQQPFDINVQLRKLLIDDVNDHMAHSSSFPTSLCGVQQPNNAASSSSRTTSAVQSSSSYTSSLSAASPQHSCSNSGTPRHQQNHNQSSSGSSSVLINNIVASTSSPVPGPSAPQSYRSPSSPAARQLAAELDELRRIGGDLQQHHLQNNSSNAFSTMSLPRSLSATKAVSAYTLPRKKLSMTSSSGGISGELDDLTVMNILNDQNDFNNGYYDNSTTTAITTTNNSNYVMSIGETTTITTTKSVDTLNHNNNPAATLSISTNRNPRRNMHRWLHNKLSLSRSSKHSTSAPNLVESDDEIMRRQRTQTASIENSKMKRDKTRSSLRNLLGKLTRSSSQEIRSAEFRRGSATRSTTMARLPSVGPVCGAIAVRPPVEQFVEWNTEQICEWMAEIGFSVYVPEVERFVRSGRHLLTMSNHDFDKELLMRNPLHRKRLRCILKNIDKGVADAADRMDVHQVLRWLDEIGLPQYRENFAENMIDGQLLTTLTAQDLVEMKITSALHHATIARGIQFLRSVDFCVHRLERRFNPDVLNKGPCPNEVERWSHHCTCQWLKTIDLAEFTPNLLCAGIHGALMVYEPTFTAESLAEVLQMPAHKTLIRRHLATHFNQLLGQEIISHKRDILAQPFVAQLTPALRIRLMKKGFSLSRKKGKNEVFVEPEELVCPPLTAKSKYLQHHQQQYLNENMINMLTSSNV